MLKQFTLSKQYTTRYHLSCKQCRSRSAGFSKSQLIWIHNVFNATCELVIINQNMKYNGQNCINLIHLYLSKDKWVNRKFQLVLNENVPVGQVGHGSSTAMLDESTTFITVGRGRPHILCANHHQIQVWPNLYALLRLFLMLCRTTSGVPNIVG